MFPVLLTKIKTRDGVMLDGIYIAPRRKSKLALIWLHGLTSKFYSGQTLIGELSRRCRQNRIGYFKFNTRGHDIAALGNKGLIGSAFEKFDDCLLDTRAIINFAKRSGYRKIILAGHSTGANKALYYLYKTKDPKVKGLILAGPTSDIAYDYMVFGKREIRRRVVAAKKIKSKNPTTLLPQKFGIWSAQRYISILEEGKPEDVFPYYNPVARWKELRRVQTPIAVIFGNRDEYLDRSVKTIIEVFRKNATSTKSFSGIIIKGGRHSFIGREKELAQTIVNWIKRVVV